VVVSSASSLPEVVGDGGTLVDPENVDALSTALIRVLTDDQFRQELRERGLERAMHFSWERTASETIEVYEKLMG
jgi:glycosyltransferase involved in cell wall biosynthesis